MTTATGPMAEINPLRCGYCYDAETGLYYLQSRYYDPKKSICRVWGMMTLRRHPIE